MSTQIKMQAIIEAPYYQDEFICPWKVSDFEPFSKIRLHPEITIPEIGLVVAKLAQYNDIELSNSKPAIIEQILEAKSLVLPGGIEVIDEREKSISPGCCCGLERWREWFNFLSTGNSPWLGHDPSPWLEMQGDMVSIWSDGLLESVRNAFCFEVSRSQLKEALKLVENDLQGFLFSLESWAQEIGVTNSKELFRKFDDCFSIWHGFIKH